MLSTTARRTPARRRTWAPGCRNGSSAERAELERFRREIDVESERTRRLLEGRSGEERLSPEACEQLKAMGYIQEGCP